MADWSEGVATAIGVAVVLGAGIHILGSAEQVFDCRTAQGYVADADPAEPDNQEVYGGWSKVCINSHKHTQAAIDLISMSP